MASLNPVPQENGGNSPIEHLREQLKAARLQAITQAAGNGGVASLSTEEIARIGHLHLALLAVRDEIDVHAPKLGAGSEAPLL